MRNQAESTTAAPLRNSGSPPYFHLLWEEDIEQLACTLNLLQTRRDEVLHRWYELYRLHLGKSCTLSEPDFKQMYGRDLETIATNLAHRDMERFVADLRELGERLVERGVSFDEVIATSHLLKESCYEVCQHPVELMGGAYYPSKSCDKVSHCRIMVLVEAYLRMLHEHGEAKADSLAREPIRSRSNLRQTTSFFGLVGQSARVQDVFQRIRAAAASAGTVFIVGETGTGKELVSRAIHQLSPNKASPFVPANCSALTRDLIESELFGFKRGAFTGAVTDHIGLFRAAEGGTLFLDEITEMSPETQAKLLRALQERTIRPVGSVHEVPVKVRIIASTNRNPQEAVRAGVLREDLYYRLNVNTIVIPPLRDRTEDLPLLVEHFLQTFDEKFGGNKKVVTTEALRQMQIYQWPGNVRELMNVLESAYTFGRSEEITLADLPPVITGQARDVPPEFSASRIPTFEETEKSLIANALSATGGNKVRAAKLLGISRKKLYAKIAKHGLEK